jgi:hypothetical protein
MIETLTEYCDSLNTEEPTVVQVKEWLGGITSKYYEICQAMVKVYLNGGDKIVKGGVILHGASTSGKSTIADYMNLIFDAHMHSQNSGGFEDEMERGETNKQLLIMNEANMYALFAKKVLHDTKKLLEGRGMSVRNKYAHPYRGFIGSKTLITCNNLPYPFKVPVASTSGFDIADFENDRYAVTSRTICVEMKTSFTRE